jgi:hypothetical protein
MLAESQEPYRAGDCAADGDVSEARQFEAGVRRLDDGEPFPLVVLSG